jgi:hypothetical protein
VDIVPQPADPDNPYQPARLAIETISGSISVSFSVPYTQEGNEMDEFCEDGFHQGEERRKKARMDKERIKNKVKNRPKRCIRPENEQYYEIAEQNAFASRLPPRSYEIDIKSEAGAISGRFIFTTQARLQSSTGSVSATLSPIVFNSSNSNSVSYSSLSSLNGHVSLFTQAKSGSQHIQLTEPFVIETATAIDDPSFAYPRSYCPATASHISHTGSMDIQYPKSWAGRVEASAERGVSICLDGRGLEVTKDGDGRAVATRKESETDSVEWWGSQGTMNVSLLSERAGSIRFSC